MGIHGFALLGNEKSGTMGSACRVEKVLLEDQEGLVFTFVSVTHKAACLCLVHFISNQSVPEGSHRKATQLKASR
jgi:hypothetical protein